MQLGLEADVERVDQMESQKDGKNKSDCFTIKSIRAKLSRPKIPKIFRKSKGDGTCADTESKKSLEADKTIKRSDEVLLISSESAPEIPNNTSNTKTPSSSKQETPSVERVTKILDGDQSHQSHQLMTESLNSCKNNEIQLDFSPESLNSSEIPEFQSDSLSCQSTKSHYLRFKDSPVKDSLIVGVSFSHKHFEKKIVLLSRKI